MILREEDLLFCIMEPEGGVMDGAFGLAIASREAAAWEVAIHPAEEWAIERAKREGRYVARIALMVVNAREVTA